MHSIDRHKAWSLTRDSARRVSSLSAHTIHTSVKDHNTSLFTARQRKHFITGNKAWYPIHVTWMHVIDSAGGGESLEELKMILP
jgi:hypothetical protein